MIRSPMITRPIIASPIITSPIITSPTSPIITSPFITSPMSTNKFLQSQYNFFQMMNLFSSIFLDSNLTIIKLSKCVNIKVKSLNFLFFLTK